MKWIGENWEKVLTAFVIILVIVGVLLVGLSVIDLIKDNKQYKANIAALGEDIKKEKKKIEIIEGINSDLMDGRKKAKAAADEKIAKMKDNQKEALARISRKLDAWKAKVKEMPTSTVVIKIRTILKTDEIWERPDGILFSLAAARDCLAVLGDFSLVKERDQWRDDYNIALNRIDDLNGIIATDEEIFYNFDDITFNFEEIIKKKEEKFNLSEGRNRASWWRGVKSGGLVLGIIGFIGGLVLGR